MGTAKAGLAWHGSTLLFRAAAVLAAVGERAEVAFVCSTDLPFLHPAFAGRVLLRELTDGPDDVDVVLPVAHGFRQPPRTGPGSPGRSRSCWHRATTSRGCSSSTAR